MNINLKHRQLLFVGVLLAFMALGCKILTNLFSGANETGNQPVAIQQGQPQNTLPEEAPLPPEEEEFEGELNGAGPDVNDQEELNIGGIQLFYDPALIAEIHGEWKDASGSNMNEPWPAYIHYDLPLDAGTINLIEVFSLEYVSASYEMALDEVRDLLVVQPTANIDCIPEVSRDTAYQQCDHQQFVSNLKYLEFKNGTGVRWVTVCAIQDAVAVSNEFLIYRFQGLTANGECYLKASFQITHAELPENAMLPNGLDTYEALQDYFSGFQIMLDNNPGGYMPALEHFDAMIESMAVGVCGAG